MLSCVAMPETVSVRLWGDIHVSRAQAPGQAVPKGPLHKYNAKLICSLPLAA